jgi:hypothetical protein
MAFPFTFCAQIRFCSAAAMSAHVISGCSQIISQQRMKDFLCSSREISKFPGRDEKKAGALPAGEGADLRQWWQR